jgi:S-layer protein
MDGVSALTLNDTANFILDTGSALLSVATIVVTGAGTTTLGDLVDGFGSPMPGLKSITATGSGPVMVEINPLKTAFTGGGNDTVALNQNPGVPSVTSPVINGGGGGTLYANYAASAGDVPLGATSQITGFSNLGVVGLAGGGGNHVYNAEDFRGLVVGAFNPYGVGAATFQGIAGAIDFTNVELGASLDLVDPSGQNITYDLTSFIGGPLPGSVLITIGQDGSATTGTGLATTGTANLTANVLLNTVNDELIAVTVNSQGAVNQISNLIPGANLNTLHLSDPTLALLTITGDQALVVTNASPDTSLSLIDASKSTAPFVNVNQLAVDIVQSTTTTTGGVTVLGGAGLIEATGDQTFANLGKVPPGVNPNGGPVDTYNIGTGGGQIIIGDGGAGLTFNAKTLALQTDISGSETINLTATAPVGTAIGVPGDATTEFNGGKDGGFVTVNNWSSGSFASGQTADPIAFFSTGVLQPVVIANASSVTGTVNGGLYNISNGVISVATGSPSLSGAEQLADALAILDNAKTTGTLALLTAPVVGGNGMATFLIEEGKGGGKADTVVELNGVTGITGFGAVSPAGGQLPALNLVNTGAGSSVTIDDLTNNFGALFANVTTTDAAHESGVKSGTFADTGFTLTQDFTSAVGLTNTFTGLGNFGIVETDNGTAGGNITVTQVGSNPLLTLTSQGGAGTDHVGVLTYGAAGQNTYLLLLAGNDNLSVGAAVDSVATSTGVELASNGVFNVTVGNFLLDTGGLVDSALKVVNATGVGGEVILVANTAGVNITGTSSAFGNEIAASGAGDTISIGSAAAPASTTPENVINASGAGDHINMFGGDGNLIGAGGANDVITIAAANGFNVIDGNGVGFNDVGPPVAAQLGAGDVLTIGLKGETVTAQAWLGANNSVTIGTGSTAHLHLLGDTAGAGLTNMTVIGGLNLTTSLHFLDTLPGNVANPTIGTGQELWAAGSGNTSATVVADSQVNVASATTLAGALNLAAAEALFINQHFDGGADTTILNQNTPAAALTLDGHTAILDWFQFQGNTYIVEDVNGTANPALHGSLQAGDYVVEIKGLVNLSTFHGDFHFHA